MRVRARVEVGVRVRLTRVIRISRDEPGILVKSMDTQDNEASREGTHAFCKCTKTFCKIACKSTSWSVPSTNFIRLLIIQGVKKKKADSVNRCYCTFGYPSSSNSITRGTLISSSNNLFVYAALCRISSSLSLIHCKLAPA